MRSPSARVGPQAKNFERYNTESDQRSLRGPFGGLFFRHGMSKSGGASVKPSKLNPGDTVQLTSVQAPVVRAACQ